jgi:hypothetical protein
MNNNNDSDPGLHNKTAALLMLDKKERKLLKELIKMTLKSKNARELIAKRLGSEYIEVGENLLKIMGGK